MNKTSWLILFFAGALPLMLLAQSPMLTRLGPGAHNDGLGTVTVSNLNTKSIGTTNATLTLSAGGGSLVVSTNNVSLNGVNLTLATDLSTATTNLQAWVQSQGYASTGALENVSSQLSALSNTVASVVTAVVVSGSTNSPVGGVVDLGTITSGTELGTNSTPTFAGLMITGQLMDTNGNATVDLNAMSLLGYYGLRRVATWASEEYLQARTVNVNVGEPLLDLLPVVTTDGTNLYDSSSGTILTAGGTAGIAAVLSNGTDAAGLSVTNLGGVFDANCTLSADFNNHFLVNSVGETNVDWSVQGAVKIGSTVGGFNGLIVKPANLMFGADSIATNGIYSVALGDGVFAEGNAAVALGQYGDVYGEGSMIAGHYGVIGASGSPVSGAFGWSDSMGSGYRIDHGHDTFNVAARNGVWLSGNNGSSSNVNLYISGVLGACNNSDSMVSMVFNPTTRQMFDASADGTGPTTTGTISADFNNRVLLNPKNNGGIWWTNHADNSSLTIIGGQGSSWDDLYGAELVVVGASTNSIQAYGNVILCADGNSGYDSNLMSGSNGVTTVLLNTRKRQFMDGTGTTSFDFNNRGLVAPDGTTTNLEWGASTGINIHTNVTLDAGCNLNVGTAVGITTNVTGLAEDGVSTNYISIVGGIITRWELTPP